MSIVLIGMGISGLACALELSRNNIVFDAYEMDREPGGTAKTDHVGLFSFDWGPHILIGLDSQRIEDLEELDLLDIAARTGTSAIVVDANKNIIVPGIFQRNLYSLPLSDRFRIFRELMMRSKPGTARNYKEYLVRRCGSHIYELFFEGYETKRLQIPLDSVVSEGTARIVSPSLRSLVAKLDASRNSGATVGESQFHYPRSGGIESLPRAMALRLPAGAITYGAALSEIDLQRKRLEFSDGRKAYYEKLGISIPLSTIVSMIRDPPTDIVLAAKNLIYTSIQVASFGVTSLARRPWSFMRFPQFEPNFYRLTFPCTFASDIAPPSTEIIVAELAYHSERRPISAEEATDAIRTHLIGCGILRSETAILVEHCRRIEIGNIVYVTDTAKSLAHIRKFLQDNGVFLYGKYGLWRDMLMTGAMHSGRCAAKAMCS